MKKFILALLLSSILFYGCGNNEESKTEEQETVEKDDDKQDKELDDGEKFDASITVVEEYEFSLNTTRPVVTDGEESTFYCSYNYYGTNTIEITVDATGNEVTYYEFANTFTYTSIDVPIETIEASAEVVSIAADVDEGIEYSYEYDDTTFTERTTVDLATADLAYAIKHSFVVVDEEDLEYLDVNTIFDDVYAAQGMCQTVTKTS